jgi:hypothetical protein
MGQMVSYKPSPFSITSYSSKIFTPMPCMIQIPWYFPSRPWFPTMAVGNPKWCSHPRGRQAMSRRRGSKQSTNKLPKILEIAEAFMMVGVRKSALDITSAM